jgi:hypothetical protein
MSGHESQFTVARRCQGKLTKSRVLGTMQSVIRVSVRSWS